METLCLDFLEWLGPDTSTTVLMLLDDFGDLVRVCAVSKSWRRFVIMNGLVKNLCLRIFPEVSNFTHVEVCDTSKDGDVGSSSDAEWKILEREYRVYSHLSHLLTLAEGKMDCIHEALCASSTDNFPDESIENTLEPSDLVDRRPSYWSSGGQKDARVPESLTYKLNANLCLVSEIKIQPFKAFFQHGRPIYSSKFVRFRMGYLKSTEALKSRVVNGHMEHLVSGDNFVWTYVSPEFPMAQENVLQSFTLPDPALCIGGIVQIELLGRVQTQAMDDLYYICVSHVQVIGQPLLPVFDVDIQQAEGKIVLKYFPDATPMLPASSLSAEDEAGDASPWKNFRARLRHFGAGNTWNQAFLDVLLGPIHVPDDEYDDSEDSTDTDEEGFGEAAI